MVAWRESCRQCGARPAKNRAWCPKCLKRIRDSGVTDLDDFPTWEECVSCGAPDAASLVVSTRGGPPG